MRVSKFFNGIPGFGRTAVVKLVVIPSFSSAFMRSFVERCCIRRLRDVRAFCFVVVFVSRRKIEHRVSQTSGPRCRPCVRPRAIGSDRLTPFIIRLVVLLLRFRCLVMALSDRPLQVVTTMRPSLFSQSPDTIHGKLKEREKTLYFTIFGW